ncbi:hypothetical protein NMY22_g14953 [Coprinellus aureogranulatus]|nr:hypothetical protein NMY22_g14953 [Coprinellus aureogranulatus]
MLCRNVALILALAVCGSALPVAVTASSRSVNNYVERRLRSPQLLERDELGGLVDERLYLFKMVHMGNKKPPNRPAIKQPPPLQGIGAGIKPPSPEPVKFHPVAKP